MKIMAVCAHGLGSSFLMEMNIKKGAGKNWTLKRKSATPTSPLPPPAMPTCS